MKVISSHTYNVIDGEPQLGKQIEMVVQVDRDEYIEGLADALLNGCVSTADTFEIQDDEVGIQEYSLGCDLTQTDIDEILKEMDEQLVDDDWGTDKAYNLVYELLDAYIPDHWVDEFEIVEMRG